MGIENFDPGIDRTDATNLPDSESSQVKQDVTGGTSLIYVQKRAGVRLSCRFERLPVTPRPQVPNTHEADPWSILVGFSDAEACVRSRAEQAFRARFIQNVRSNQVAGEAGTTRTLFRAARLRPGWQGPPALPIVTYA